MTESAPARHGGRRAVGTGLAREPAPHAPAGTRHEININTIPRLGGGDDACSPMRYGCAGPGTATALRKHRGDRAWPNGRSFRRIGLGAGSGADRLCGAARSGRGNGTSLTAAQAKRFGGIGQVLAIAGSLGCHPEVRHKRTLLCQDQCLTNSIIEVARGINVTHLQFEPMVEHHLRDEMELSSAPAPSSPVSSAPDGQPSAIAAQRGLRRSARTASPSAISLRASGGSQGV